MLLYQLTRAVKPIRVITIAQIDYSSNFRQLAATDVNQIQAALGRPKCVYVNQSGGFRLKEQTSKYSVKLPPISCNQSCSRKSKPSGRYWSGEMSARSNQDNQREFEERAMKQIISIVNKRTGNDNNGRPSMSQAIGGTFVQLEAEWREKHRQTKAKPNGNKV